MPTPSSKAEPGGTAGWGRGLLWLGAALAACTAVVLLTQAWAEDLFLEQTRARAAAKLDLYASNLSGALGKYQSVPKLLALHDDVAVLFQAPDDPAVRARANQLTVTVNRLTGAEDTYFMDAGGMTFAASNWDGDKPFVGNNFSFRPYFQQAMQGRLGRYFALGTTSGKRGYYFASQVSKDGEILGAVVVKVSLDDIERSWTASEEDVIVTDPHGVIFIASRPQWRYRSLAPLDGAALSAIAENRRYESVDLRPLDVELRSRAGGLRLMSVAGAGEGESAREYVMVSQQMPEAGWTLNVLASTQLAHSQTATAMVVATLACALTLLLVTVIVQRRARLVERIEFQRRASEELERRVEERTADLRRAQDDLVQAGKLAALGQMSAALSHEFNQPLAAIRSYADNAQMLIERDRQGEAMGNLKRIKDLTGRMAEISKHLMTFARKPRRELRPVVLAEVLDDTLDFLRTRLERAGAEVTVAQFDRGLTVLAGRVRLQHVILNLVANALDAMKDRPAPRIEIDVTDRAGPDGKGQVVFSLRDHGPGIAAEELGRIFDPFFTTKDVGEGLGLGLSISYNIVKDFDGVLRAENHPGGGAVFTIELPLLERRPQAVRLKESA
ncbi:ATP-binding protein [Pelagibius sp. 7325]|uniref:sensor histidine kinase n=1 Tax=Pelagibius sp. 7325 TaxID=3131994 RepID=UPI0030EF24CD